jgi:XRE family aerobic/anaerobic benzoate catabolism transcriptional regulator
MSRQNPLLSVDVVGLSLRLGKRVRSARAARAMTMKQLAAGANISLPYLSRVEKGDGNISLAVLHKLAMALNLPADSLLADDERYGADYALIVELLKRQSPLQLREIRKRLVAHLASPQTSDTALRRIALIGIRGAGKSTVGALVAKRLNVPFVELNAEVEKEAGLSLNEIFSIYGQAGFRRLERRCLDHVVATCPEVVIATGGGIVVEPATYELLLHSFFNIWLHADPEEHFRRVMAQHDVRIAAPQLHEEAMANIVDALNARRKLYALAHAHIDTTHKQVEDLVEKIRLIVDEHISAGRPAVNVA